MTTISTGFMTIGDRMNASGVSETAFALFDERGATVAWTQAAERLVGYSAGEVVGRSAALVLPPFAEAGAMSAFVEQCRARNGWSGVTAVRHRDGHTVDVTLRISMLRGRGGTVQWLTSVSDVGVLSGEAVNGAVRGALLTSAPVGISVRDLQLRCFGVNETIEMHDGIPRERRLGRRFTDAMPGAKAEALEAVMRQVLQSGTTKVHEYRTWLPTVLGPERPFAVSFSCLQGADGQALGMCVISADVTECRLARERLTVLGHAGTRLGRTLDVWEIGQALADFAVPLFADFAAVDLEKSIPFSEGAPVRIGPVGERLPVLRRAGLASVREGVQDSPWARGDAVPLPPGSPVTEVLSTGRSHLEPIMDTAAGTWLDEEPLRARMIHESGMHSLMVVPIRTRRALLGVVVFTRSENPVPFQEIDLLLAEELVG
ncbi:PAS domain S-box protein, partial [Streptomyces wuyuanensis]